MALPFLMILFVTAANALDRNPDENAGISDPNLFEGDVILNSRQRLALKLGLDLDGRGISRGATANSNLVWPTVIPYTIDTSLSSEPTAVKAVQDAMKAWSSLTCIRFNKRTSEKNYIRFIRGKGCRSAIGCQGGRQDIILDDKRTGTCWTKGIVAHEIAHALGFYHEQSRPDRDSYVTINWDNIIPKKKGNFKSYRTSIINSLGVPYDYGSIMHYGEKYFSHNGLATIELKKKSVVTIGQRNGPSDLDYKQMNLLYKCPCIDTYRYYCSRYWYSCSDSLWMKANCRKTCGLC